MRLVLGCHRPVLALLLGCFTVGITQVQAVILNFSAVLTDGTCSLSLNKSTLALGTISKSQLRPNQLTAPQPFVLSVHSCTGQAGGSLKPVVTVTGNGVTQDNKWLFRSAGTAQGTGILVIQSDTLPAYNQQEVRHDSVLSVGNTGHVADQTLTFYAGMSCGGTTGCAAVTTGDVTAQLMFTFAYQ
ncbi:fimbrial protein [Enterobacter sp. CC120223-11]|uniref:fimbrial protein n=1 Tax=Enterobacter sp. CC120223-11 TaxID=1378073 RepID=UPI000BD88ED4|nr:fimbrial protein [Enterobacter sp. CC120223-11]SNY79865.1 Pilin (type 1 fimbria component protein) [Enterobacter sp. CC120223-11]